MKATPENCIVMYRPHPAAKRVKFHIPYEQENDRLAFKKLNTSFYYFNQKLWSVVNTKENIAKVKALFGDRLVEEDMVSPARMPKIEPSEKIQLELDRNHQKMVLKGFSESTIRTYQHALLQFFNYFEQADLPLITKEQIEGFLFHLISKYKISEQKQNTLINAIKCYYEHTLGKPREYYNVTRPKKSIDLPNVLSVEEVWKIINQPSNIKHRAVLHLMYSGGLRVGEVIRLRVCDIRSDDGYIFIKDSKGKRDRHTVLSPHLLELLRRYYIAFKPSYWLFEGQDGGPYSKRSIQNIYRRAVTATHSNPWSSPHTLRHSFATHLMQSGTNIRHIQSALGHASTKTTEVYTRVLSINNKTLKSPLDSLYETFTFGKRKPK